MQTLQTAQPAPAVAKTFFDEDGYLSDPQLWDEYLGEVIAVKEGVAPLNARHWRVIHHIRERFLLLGGLPSLRRVCRGTSLSRAEIYDLFGGCLVIWRIAGLPNPGEEAKAYLD
jgi:tRNA 2-thiouridine synthesizing protein E